MVPILAGAAAPEEQAVTGVVVDAAGRPVADAEVGTAFRLASSIAKTKTIISWDQPPVVTDAAGTFSIPAKPISYTKALVAAGRDGTLGFVLREPNVPARIRLSPPARLELELIKSFGSSQRMSFDLMAGGSAVGYGEATPGKAQFLVPAGAVEVSVHDVESHTSTTKVSFDASSLMRLQVTLQPTGWVQTVGKPAPRFTPTDVQNFRAGQSLDSAPGKWVLVEFWATWCVPCIRDMGKFIAFYEKHSALRDRFEIVAVHSPDGASLAAIKEEYEQLVDRAWAGKHLPFPLLFDATGKTHERWGVEVYPTTLLIDPQGRVVGLTTIEDLGKKLGL